MDWRELEREIIDILRKVDAPVTSEAGDAFVIDDKGDFLFSITELSKRLVERLS